jgi:hypothetical protein
VRQQIPPEIEARLIALQQRGIRKPAWTSSEYGRLLGMPPGARHAGGTYRRDDRPGWRVEWFGIRVGERPIEAPWLAERLGSSSPRYVELWQMRVIHEDTGFVLNRYWHPDFGRYWVASSDEPDFRLLREARRLLNRETRGRKPALRSPEQIIVTFARLQKAAGKPPEPGRLAAELDCSLRTLQRRIEQWGLGWPPTARQNS